MKRSRLAAVIVVGAIGTGTLISSRYIEKRDTVSEIVHRDGSDAASPFPKVSVAEIGKDVVVTADYVALQMANLATGKTCTLRAFRGEREIIGPRDLAALLDPYSEGVEFSPTGVFADANAGLFVANYKGNNILQGRIDQTNCRLDVTNIYSSHDTLGPENVAVDPQKGILVSANYDSGTIVAFSLGTAQKLWSAVVPQAHGVAISGNRVFATGLLDRKLYELDAKDGSISRSVGSLGWDANKNQYLWPTTVYPFGSDELVLADPQTGEVSFVDKATFTPKRSFGRNGPGARDFNYPYAAVPYQGGLLVLSSYSGELQYLPSGDGRVKRVVYNFGAPSQFREERRARLFNVVDTADRTQWDGYLSKNQSIKVFGQDFKLSFGAIQSDSGKYFRMPNIGTAGNPLYYMYFMQGAQTLDGKWSLLSSSSSDSLIAVPSQADSVPVIIRKDIGLDAWFVGDTLETKSATVKLLDYSQEMNSIAKKLDERRKATGWLTVEDIEQTNALPTGGGGALLDASFQTSAGREFKLVYDQCAKDSCKADEIKAAARSYYGRISGSSSIPIDEYALVGMIAGVSPVRDATINETNASECEGSSFYQGSGPENLATETLDDYISAVNLDGSIICLNTPNSTPMKINSVNIIWYSLDEAASKVEISTDSDGAQEIYRVDLQPPTMIGGYAVSKVTAPDMAPSSRYRLKIVQAGAQNRLLARHISAEFASQAAATDSQQSDLLQLSKETKQSIKYGPRTTSRIDSVQSFRTAIQQDQTGDCGIYAFWLASALPDDQKWEAFDLITRDGRAHTLVEVLIDGRKFAADPTLGVIYQCSVSDMLTGKCSDHEYRNRRYRDPILRAYHGAGFLYGAHIKRRYSKLSEFVAIHNQYYSDQSNVSE